MVRLICTFTKYYNILSFEIKNINNNMIPLNLFYKTTHIYLKLIVIMLVKTVYFII